MNVFQAVVKTKLKERGLSQADLARLLGKTPVHISNVLRDPNPLNTIKTRIQICRVLGLDETIVLVNDEPSEPEPAISVEA